MFSTATELAESGISDLQIALVAGGFLIAGALIAFLSSLVTGRKDRDRADRVRWDDQILGDALEVIKISEWIRSQSFVDVRDECPYHSKLIEQPKQLERYRDVNHRLQLIASKDVNTASAKLVSRAERLGEQRTAEDIKAARDALNEAVQGFRQAVRKELNARD